MSRCGQFGQFASEAGMLVFGIFGSLSIYIIRRIFAPSIEYFVENMITREEMRYKYRSEFLGNVFESNIIDRELYSTK